MPAAVSLRRPFVCQECARRIRRYICSSSATFHSTSAVRSTEQYDVICVGGGPAGLGLMTALKSHPSTSSLRLALIEGQDLAAASKWTLPPDSFSNRASSLTPGTRDFLERIGAWPHLDSARVQAYQRMQVWDGLSGARIQFEWEGYQANRDGSTVAYMTENANLVRGLMARLNEVGDIGLRDRTRVANIKLPEPPSSTPLLNSSSEQPALDLSSWPHVSLSSGDTLAARLLVGADGANSPVRSFAGIDSSGWDYGRLGVVATLELADGVAVTPTAFQRFLPTGPVALLPLPGKYATLVWSTTPENARVLRSLNRADFVAMVNAAFRLSAVDLAYLHTLGQGQADEVAWRMQHTPSTGADGIEVPYLAAEVQQGTVAAFPLKLRHADTYATHRVALVGDAAHTVHPLAGQGLNMGMGDAEALAETLVYAAEHGMDIGDQMSLERYNTARYATNNALLGTVDKLHKLYSVSSGPIVSLRSWGLQAINMASPVKEFLMKQAAG